MRRSVTTAAVGAAAIAAIGLAASPAGAATDNVSAGGRAAAPSAAAANTSYSQITDFFCGRINNVPYVGAQSRQAKWKTNTYYMSQTHVVQGFSGGRWVNLGSKKYYKSAPVAGVWYYAPNTSGDQLWNLSGWTGSFRVQVKFQWKQSDGSVGKATSTTPVCTKS